jgi:hypothetical protein
MNSTSLAIVMGAWFSLVSPALAADDDTNQAKQTAQIKTALLEELKQNTQKLHECFKQKDLAREKELYTQRHEILVKLQDLKPKKPPTVREGTVQEINDHGIFLRTHPDYGVSMRLSRNRIAAAVRQKYGQIKKGDYVILTFTSQPSLYFDDRYVTELTGVQINPSANDRQERR